MIACNKKTGYSPTFIKVFLAVVVFEVKFEGRVGCYDSKQGEALGAVRTGKRASVFGNGNTRGRKCTEIRVGRHAGAGVYRALRND